MAHVNEEVVEERKEEQRKKKSKAEREAELKEKLKFAKYCPKEKPGQSWSYLSNK